MLRFPLMVFEDSSANAGPFSSEDFLNKLFPNFWSFLINLLALIVLFVVIFFLAYKPVKKFVKARQDYVEGNIRDSEAAKKEYEEKLEQSDALIDEAKKEANVIVDKARLDATAEALRIQEEAKKQAAKQIQDAEETIRLAEKKSRETLQEEIVNVAMDASKQVLGREVNEEDHKRLLDDFVRDVTGKDGHGE